MAFSENWVYASSSLSSTDDADIVRYRKILFKGTRFVSTPCLSVFDYARRATIQQENTTGCLRIKSSNPEFFPFEFARAYDQLEVAIGNKSFQIALVKRIKDTSLKKRPS